MNTQLSTNRRQFLQQTAGITAATLSLPYFVPAAALGRDGQVAANERITLGSIGVGSMGRGDLKNLMKDFIRKMQNFTRPSIYFKFILLL